jgi:acetoin utilization protein AcuA
LERLLKTPGAEVFVRDTPRGRLSIRNHCPPGSFDGLVLDNGLGVFAHYSSIIRNLDILEEVASGEEGRVTLALIEGKTIVGYGACWYPPDDDRWSRLDRLMYEMGALEVSRNYRGMGIAKLIFAAIMNDDFFEDKIAYMNGFSWHWDLDESFLTIGEYRKMMIKLLKEHGFQECYTNEPNIALREENFFTVRTGRRVSEGDCKAFRNLRFGILPQ